MASLPVPASQISKEGYYIPIRFGDQLSNQLLKQPSRKLSEFFIHSSAPTSSMSKDHFKNHHNFSKRSNWLRAAILGASDGVISESSLILGVLASGRTDSIIIVGTSALVAGALTMALGEWSSVGSTRDSEEADIAFERKQHLKGGIYTESKFKELKQMFVHKGLSEDLAHQVAEELSAKDLDELVKIHVFEEYGIDADELTSPIEAMSASGISFVLGAVVPLVIVVLTADNRIMGILLVMIVSLIMLVIFGLAGAYVGGYSYVRGVARVALGGSIALGVTFAIGMLFSTPT